MNLAGFDATWRHDIDINRRTPIRRRLLSKRDLRSILQCCHTSFLPAITIWNSHNFNISGRDSVKKFVCSSYGRRTSDYTRTSSLLSEFTTRHEREPSSYIRKIIIQRMLVPSPHRVSETAMNAFTHDAPPSLHDKREDATGAHRDIRTVHLNQPITGHATLQNMDLTFPAS